MKKLPIISRVLTLATLSLVSCLAQASSYTFEFVMPSWTTNTNAGLFGTNAVLDITADNGSTTFANQSYLGSQITQINMSVSGGSFYEMFSTNLSGSTTLPALISTNSSGAPTLNLLPQPIYAPSSQVYAITPVYPGYEIDLEQFNVGSLSPHFSILNLGNSDYAEYAPGFEVAGTTLGVSPVPEADTATMFLAGFGLVGFVASRKNKKVS